MDADSLFDEDLARAAHRSLAVTWGTTAPYELGRVQLRRVGFANLPRLVVPAYCRERDIGSLVPIARQAAFSYLAERGVADTHLQFTPGVTVGRRRKFVDADGRNRMGVQVDIAFDMGPLLACAVQWDGSRGVLRAPWELAG